MTHFKRLLEFVTTSYNNGDSISELEPVSFIALGKHADQDGNIALKTRCGSTFIYNVVHQVMSNLSGHQPRETVYRLLTVGVFAVSTAKEYISKLSATSCENYALETYHATGFTFADVIYECDHYTEDTEAIGIAEDAHAMEVEVLDGKWEPAEHSKLLARFDEWKFTRLES